MIYLGSFSRHLHPIPLVVSSLVLILKTEWVPVGVECRVVNMTLTVATNDGRNVTQTFKVEEQQLEKLHITKEDVEASLPHAEADGKVREVVIGKKHIPIFLNILKEPNAVVFSYNTIYNTTWSVTRANYTNVTIDNFKNDPTLEPMSVPLDWTLPSERAPTVSSFTLTSAPVETGIQVNNEVVLRLHNNGTLPKGFDVIIVPFNGLHLRVLNPYTGRVTLSRHFALVEYYSDQEMINTLRTLQHGRIAMLTALHDAWGRLAESSREYLSSLGSFAVQHIRFRDCWSWVWQVGAQRTLGEALVTNPDGIMSLPPPLQLDVPFPSPAPAGRLCKEWPSGIQWERRHHFCDVYDGYADLCSCDDPYRPSVVPKMATWRENIGIVVLAGKRTRYLYRLLKQVLDQPGVRRDHLFVSVDGPFSETIKLLKILSIKYRVHQPEGQRSNVRISRHLRFALFKALDLLQVDKFIMLEDDLALSPDFYSYMQQTSVILDRDPTVYGVSSYNHFSYEHTARDPTRLLRVHSLPSPGWMVKRSFIMETLPLWIPIFVDNDWDYWMGSDLVRKGREVILPEISRTAHAGLTGEHVSGLLTMKRYSNKPVTTDPDTVVNLTTIDRKATEKEIQYLLQKARLLNVTNPYTFPFPTSAGEVGLVFVKLLREEDMESLKVLGDALKVWNQDTRDHHFGLWRFPYHDATMLIMGVPFSQYSKHYKAGYNVVQANEENTSRMMEDFLSEKISFKPHQPGDDARLLGLEPDDPHSSYLNKIRKRL